jgi:D-alanyl-lipoteichoic acid acyltransferase DltB (MBOAT superfamily)
MTLSRFCFDYIYKPLGGNRHSELRTYLNTLITFAIIGFWHGANWNYVLFGIYHAAGVIGTRMLTGLVARQRGRERYLVEAELAGRAIPILATNVFIIGSLPLFRSPDMSTAFLVYRQLATWHTLSLVFSTLSVVVLLCAVISHYVPERWESELQRRAAATPAAVQVVVVFVIGVIVLHMATIAQQSFVYFQF